MTGKPRKAGKNNRSGEGGGRPKKLLCVEILDRLAVILKDEANAIMCTDNDLLVLLNKDQPKERQISKATLENWKRGNYGHWDDTKPDLWGMTEADFYARFLGLIEESLVQMKAQLFKKIKTDKKAWQRWTWIIERKFKDWNLKQVSEVDMRVGSLADEREKVNGYAGS